MSSIPAHCEVYSIQSTIPYISIGVGDFNIVGYNLLMRPFHLILGPKWNKKSLTWRLNNFTPDLANSVVRYVSLSGQYGSQILDTDYEKKIRKNRNNHTKKRNTSGFRLFM